MTKQEKPKLTQEFVKFVKFIISELKPKPPYFTPFNMITIPIILVGLVILVFRFTKGLGAVTNLSQE
ncbi:MAG: hypothetical protein MUP98_12205, partial [Candidatus Aminicenantes bacterium]|nr:hypothetical protein [Candidatus Aminicenantes bacterium]